MHIILIVGSSKSARTTVGMMFNNVIRGCNKPVMHHQGFSTKYNVKCIPPIDELEDEPTHVISDIATLEEYKQLTKYGTGNATITIVRAEDGKVGTYADAEVASLLSTVEQHYLISNPTLDQLVVSAVSIVAELKL